MELTVPKAVPPPPHSSTLPYSELLYRKCKDLAYEHRVEDAIRVRREADMARARERGYPAGGTFAAHDPTQSATAGIEVTISTGGSRQDISTSPQSVIEPVKWTIEKSLPNLTPKEEQEIFGALVCGVLGVGGYDEILTVTLGSNLSWPAFEEWFWRFNEAKFWPSTWELVRDYRELYESNFRQPTDPMLATIYSLSLPARRLSQVPWLLRSDYTNLHDGDFDAATQELLSAGLAVRCEDLPITERLCLLPMSSVRAIQRKHGVNGARSKEQIVKNLLSSIAEEELARELPSDASLKSTVNLQQLDRYQFEHTRAKLLAGTLGDMITHYNRLKQFQDNQHMDGGWPYKMRTYISEQSPKCPFCTHAAKTFDKMREATLDAMPPFHPGCTCGLDECEE